MTTADYPSNSWSREKNTPTIFVRVLIIPLVSKVSD